jgi:hypothetical protein
LGEHTGSPLLKTKKKNIKMVKACGYELVSDPQLKLGVDLRGLVFIIWVSV